MRIVVYLARESENGLLDYSYYHVALIFLIKITICFVYELLFIGSAIFEILKFGENSFNQITSIAPVRLQHGAFCFGNNTKRLQAHRQRAYHPFVLTLRKTYGIRFKVQIEMTIYLLGWNDACVSMSLNCHVLM